MPLNSLFRPFQCKTLKLPNLKFLAVFPQTPPCF